MAAGVKTARGDAAILSERWGFESCQHHDSSSQGRTLDVNLAGGLPSGRCLALPWVRSPHAPGLVLLQR